jgi:hypothetical protein
MNTVIQARALSEDNPPDRLDDETETGEQLIAAHVGAGYRITPIGARRFRYTKYTRACGLTPTGWLIDTFVLPATSTGTERLSDRASRSDRVRSW